MVRTKGLPLFLRFQLPKNYSSFNQKMGRLRMWLLIYWIGRYGCCSLGDSIVTRISRTNQPSFIVLDLLVLENPVLAWFRILRTAPFFFLEYLSLKHNVMMWMLSSLAVNLLTKIFYTKKSFKFQKTKSDGRFLLFHEHPLHIQVIRYILKNHLNLFYIPNN